MCSEYDERVCWDGVLGWCAVVRLQSECVM